MNNDVYYKVFRDKDRQLCVVTLQDFDEHHYDQSRFVTDEKFKTLMAAMDWLEDYKDRHSRQRGLKKSDLKEALINLFRNNIIQYDEIADLVIDLVEEMGMVPPTRDADRKSSYGYARVTEWEKEE